jgi:ribosomal protein S12 methylthiotransferase accessory factor
MFVGAGGVSTLVGSLDLLVDDRLGIIRRIGPSEAGAGAPDFFHAEAEICDTAAFGGPRARRLAGAASTERQVALESATARALAAYTAALYDRDGLPLAGPAEAPFANVRPTTFALFSKAQYDRPGFPYVPVTDATPLRWASAVDLATGEEVHLPAAFVFYPFPYRRRGGDLPIVPANAAGIVCAESVAEAALAGLYEIVAQDAAALFWQAQNAPPQLKLATLPEALRDLVRRFEKAGDKLVILDATTDNTIPTFVAILSSQREGEPAFVLECAADLDAGTAVARVLIRLAETRRRSREALRSVPAVGPANEWEDLFEPVDHIRFAADRDNRRYFDFAFATDLERDFNDYEPREPASFDADLESSVKLIATGGHRAYAANLTTDDVGFFGLNVCRVVVPGYLPLATGYRFRPLGASRLHETPRRLGYRGVKPGEPDNPAPHPFCV